MKIRLTNNYISTRNSSDEYKQFIENNKGKLVDVDTNYLFANQYNTIEGFRIYDNDVIEVVDDKRTIYHVQCKYCGKQGVGSVNCSCNKGLINPFTPDNSLFMNENANELKTCIYSMDEVKSILRNIKGIKISEDIPNHIELNNYTLAGYPSLDYYRISSSRNTINFIYDFKNQVYYINTGIGYTKTDKLDIPQAVQNKLDKIMNTIYKENLQLNIIDEFNKIIDTGFMDLKYQVNYDGRKDVNGNKLYDLQIFEGDDNITIDFKGSLGRYNKNRECITFNSYDLKSSIEYIIKSGL